jgi:hypothetical protein
VKVLDYKGNEIKVGLKCVYGSPDSEDRDDAIVEVIEISEPDVLYNPITDTDDGGYACFITIKFPDGETEKLQANINMPGYWGDPDNMPEEIYEEGGDLEVIE